MTPNPLHVLVLFSNQDPAAERLALAAGLGAVQAGGEIRLRLLAEQEKDAPLIHRGYVTPRNQDWEWADILIFGLGGDEEEKRLAENLTTEAERVKDKLQTFLFFSSTATRELPESLLATRSVRILQKEDLTDWTEGELTALLREKLLS